MPNSLIFVVILAVWAAYLIQHWIRRRDHVATAKSVDRFSEAMRVLERRQSMPRADISPARPRSYAVSPARPAHPDVLVKRARSGGQGTATAERARARRPSAARLRAAALVIGAAALVAGALAALAFRAPWWTALVGVATLLLAVTFVRVSAGRSRRRATSLLRSGTGHAAPSRRAPSRTAHPAPRRRTTTRPAAERGARTAVRPVGPRRQVAEAARGGASSALAAQRTRVTAWEDSPAEDSPSEVASAGQVPSPSRNRSRRVEIYDVEAVEARIHHEVAEPDPVAMPVAEPEPGTWAPVPVPPPTYTLKARAPRRAEDSRPGRAVEDLPFDGHALALDEEFEDLPPVHSVG